MNPGKLNRRIQFNDVTSVQNEYGGSVPTDTIALTTWGSVQSVKQYNQFAIEAGASVLNDDRILIIRYRKEFTPKKEMTFIDLSEPNVTYVIHSVSPYSPGSSTKYESKDDSVFQNDIYVYIIGVKQS